MGTKKAKGRTAKKAGRRRGRTSRKIAGFPHGLAEYVEDVQSMFENLERELAKAGTRTQREAGRFVRETSKQLARMEKRGEEIWSSWRERTREEALHLIESLRQAVAPPAPRKTRRRTA